LSHKNIKLIARKRVIVQIYGKKQKQTKILFRRKLTEDRIPVMFATIQFRTVSSCLLSKNIKIRIYTPIILPVVLYRCETWSVTLRQEHRLVVFENSVLRRIFQLKRDEVMEWWRKMHN
jgi:hypothetical protein